MPAIEVDLFRPSTVEQYNELDEALGSMLSRSKSLWEEAMRWLVVNDLFFLTTRVNSTRDLFHKASGKSLFERPFILDRCRELEEDEHNKPVVWGRGMGKSSLRTKGRNIQRVLGDPNSAGCIFSFQKKAAKKHLRGIRDELENNILLQRLFPDVLYENPRSREDGSSCWNLDEGLSVKRATGRPEQSFEAHAFMDGLPTGSHYNRIDWDDVEDDKAVGTADMIEKLHYNFAQSGNLKTRAGAFVRAPTGTFYHAGGLMVKLVREAGDFASLWPGEDLSRAGDGPLGGSPIYYETEELWEWWNELGDPNVYAMQVACDYKAGSSLRLSPSSLVEYSIDPLEFGRNCYIYICVDPSMGEGDPTVAWVWGTTPDRKFAWLDVVCQKLRPQERNEAILAIASKWDRIGAGLQEIRIEEFGQADYVDSTRRYFERNSWTPVIVKCADNRLSKIERIYERWQQPLAEGRILVPKQLVVRDENGGPLDALSYFKNYELGEMPKPATDNYLDAGALIWESEERVGPVHFPPSEAYAIDGDEEFDLDGGGFMSAGVL